MKRMWIQMWTVGAIVIIVMLAFVAVAQAGDCVDEVTGEPGVSHPVDGCITIAEYDEWFSYEALSEAPSLVDPGRSVAEVYHIAASAAPASERPRYFMGVELLTFREIVEQIAL